MWQELVIGLLVGLAGLYLLRRGWLQWRGRSGCGCGSAACDGAGRRGSSDRPAGKPESRRQPR